MEKGLRINCKKTILMGFRRKKISRRNLRMVDTEINKIQKIRYLWNGYRDYRKCYSEIRRLVWIGKDNFQKLNHPLRKKAISLERMKIVLDGYVISVHQYVMNGVQCFRRWREIFRQQIGDSTDGRWEMHWRSILETRKQ